MSEYISFFVRHQDSPKIIELATYCRSSYMFQTFKDTAPYESIKAARIEDLNEAQVYLKDVKKDHKAIIKEFKDKINMLAALPVVSAEDAMALYNDYCEVIKESEEEVRQLKYFINIVDFLKEILEQEDNILYIGKEIYKPTIDDIV